MVLKLRAFLWKDWVQAKSYRLAFVMKNAGMFLPLVLLFFLARAFDDVTVPSVARYGGDYIAFSAVGVVVATYSGTALRAFSSSLRKAQSRGTLEILFLTEASLLTMVFGWALFPFIRATIQMVVLLAVGLLIVDLRLSGINFVGAAITLGLTVTIMAALGIMVASFTLVFKQGDPFTSLVVLAGALFSGTVYPVSSLPGAVQAFSNVLPQTHAIEAVRLSVLGGYSIAQLGTHLLILLVYVVLLLPLSLATLSLAARRAKVEGSLAHY